MSLEKLVAEYGEFQKRQSELVKNLRIHFPPLFAKLFEKHTWVESISWRQCEPWCDGDETEFEVLCDKDRIYINDMDSYNDEVHENKGKQKAFADFADALKEIPTEIMKVMFGDSNEIEVRKSGEMIISKYEDG